jgi:hypothetical protein
MMKEGMSEDLFYSLFVQCFMCQAVVLESRFPQDHRCPRKLIYGRKDRDIHTQAHILSIRGQEGGIPTDIPTDVDTDTDADTDSQ